MSDYGTETQGENDILVLDLSEPHFLEVGDIFRAEGEDWKVYALSPDGWKAAAQLANQGTDHEDQPEE